MGKKDFTVNPEKGGRGRPKKGARKPLNIISLDDLEKLGKDINPVKETRGRPKGCTQKQIMYNNYAMGHLPLMIEPLTELEQLGKLGIKRVNNLASFYQTPCMTSTWTRQRQTLL